jgi:CubicO group peptidase (beta-lactamase class C family)
LLPEEDGTWNLIMTEAFSQLCDFAEEQMDEIGVPGVALGVLHEGEMATAAFGVTNVDHPLEVTAKTLFQIGSITKTFTAMAVLRLVDMGLLELGATIRTYLPDFKVVDEAAATGATIRHLLTHTANWVGDFFIDTGAGDEALARYTAAMAQLEQLAPLDTVWSYNVASFCLAGYVIEVLTGKSYRSALQDLVLEPLGLESVYFDAGGVITHRFAVGHGVGKKGSAVLRPWGLPRAFDPTGGIITDLKTLLRYAHFHLGDGKTEDGARLLQPQLMALMHAPQVTNYLGQTGDGSFMVHRRHRRRAPPFSRWSDDRTTFASDAGTRPRLRRRCLRQRCPGRFPHASGHASSTGTLSRCGDVPAATYRRFS